MAQSAVLRCLRYLRLLHPCQHVPGYPHVSLCTGWSISYPTMNIFPPLTYAQVGRYHTLQWISFLYLLMHRLVNIIPYNEHLSSTYLCTGWSISYPTMNIFPPLTYAHVGQYHILQWISFSTYLYTGWSISYPTMNIFPLLTYAQVGQYHTLPWISFLHLLMHRLVNIISYNEYLSPLTYAQVGQYHTLQWISFLYLLMHRLVNIILYNEYLSSTYLCTGWSISYPTMNIFPLLTYAHVGQYHILQWISFSTYLCTGWSISYPTMNIFPLLTYAQVGQYHTLQWISFLHLLMHRLVNIIPYNEYLSSTYLCTRRSISYPTMNIFLHLLIHRLVNIIPYNEYLSSTYLCTGWSISYSTMNIFPPLTYAQVGQYHTLQWISFLYLLMHRLVNIILYNEYLSSTYLCTGWSISYSTMNIFPPLTYAQVGQYHTLQWISFLHLLMHRLVNIILYNEYLSSTYLCTGWSISYPTMNIFPPHTYAQVGQYHTLQWISFLHLLMHRLVNIILYNEYLSSTYLCTGWSISYSTMNIFPPLTYAQVGQYHTLQWTSFLHLLMHRLVNIIPYNEHLSSTYLCTGWSISYSTMNIFPLLTYAQVGQYHTLQWISFLHLLMHRLVNIILYNEYLSSTYLCTGWSISYPTMNIFPPHTYAQVGQYHTLQWISFLYLLMHRLVNIIFYNEYLSSTYLCTGWSISYSTMNIFPLLTYAQVGQYHTLQWISFLYLLMHRLVNIILYNEYLSSTYLCTGWSISYSTMNIFPPLTYAQVGQYHTLQWISFLYLLMHRLVNIILYNEYLSSTYLCTGWSISYSTMNIFPLLTYAQVGQYHTLQWISFLYLLMHRLVNIILYNEYLSSTYLCTGWSISYSTMNIFPLLTYAQVGQYHTLQWISFLYLLMHRLVNIILYNEYLSSTYLCSGWSISYSTMNIFPLLTYAQVGQYHTLQWISFLYLLMHRLVNIILYNEYLSSTYLCTGWSISYSTMNIFPPLTYAQVGQYHTLQWTSFLYLLMHRLVNIIPYNEYLSSTYLCTGWSISYPTMNIFPPLTYAQVGQYHTLQWTSFLYLLMHRLVNIILYNEYLSSTYLCTGWSISYSTMNIFPPLTYAQVGQYHTLQWISFLHLLMHRLVNIIPYNEHLSSTYLCTGWSISYSTMNIFPLLTYAQVGQYHTLQWISFLYLLMHRLVNIILYNEYLSSTYLCTGWSILYSTMNIFPLLTYAQVGQYNTLQWISFLHLLMHRLVNIILYNEYLSSTYLCTGWSISYPTMNIFPLLTYAQVGQYHTLQWISFLHLLMHRLVNIILYNEYLSSTYLCTGWSISYSTMNIFPPLTYAQVGQYHTLQWTSFLHILMHRLVNIILYNEYLSSTYLCTRWSISYPTMNIFLHLLIHRLVNIIPYNEYFPLLTYAQVGQYHTLQWISFLHLLMHRLVNIILYNEYLSSTYLCTGWSISYSTMNIFLHLLIHRLVNIIPYNEYISSTYLCTGWSISYSTMNIFPPLTYAQVGQYHTLQWISFLHLLMHRLVNIIPYNEYLSSTYLCTGWSISYSTMNIFPPLTYAQVGQYHTLQWISFLQLIMHRLVNIILYNEYLSSTYLCTGWSISYSTMNIFPPLTYAQVGQYHTLQWISFLHLLMHRLVNIIPYNEYLSSTYLCTGWSISYPTMNIFPPHTYAQVDQYHTLQWISFLYLLMHTLVNIISYNEYLSPLTYTQFGQYHILQWISFLYLLMHRLVDIIPYNEHLSSTYLCTGWSISYPTMNIFPLLTYAQVGQYHTLQWISFLYLLMHTLVNIISYNEYLSSTYLCTRWSISYPTMNIFPPLTYAHVDQYHTTKSGILGLLLSRN